MPRFGIKRLHLIMGLQCNVRCIMCYQTSFSREHNMPEVIFQEHLKPLYPEVTSIKLQGDEPTIMRNCKEFCLMARQYPDMKVVLTTNGININSFWLETLVNQGEFVNFSINAASKQTYDRIVKHGNFDKVKGNIEKLVANNQGGQLRTSLSMVLLPANLAEIPDYLELGAGLGVDEVNFGVDPLLSYKSLPPREELHGLLTRAYQLIKAGPFKSEGLDAFARRVGFLDGGEAAPKALPMCTMPFWNLVVDEKGDVRVCCNTWQVMGNTYQQSLEQILTGPKIKRFRKKIRNNDYGWCDPKCPENPHPNRLAMLNKYAYAARRDPKEFAIKARNKLRRKAKM